MINKTSHVLMREHENIVKAGKVIEGLDSLVSSNPELFRQIVEELLIFFKEYSDGYHHHKEEEILFPAMQEHPDFLLGEIIDELNEHHSDFREYTADIIEYLRRNENAEALSTLKKYFKQLDDHIAVENDELFPMSENLFSEEELENIYFRYQDTDRDLGEQRKKDMESIPENLLQKLTLS